MTTWNYRIIRHSEPSGEEWFGLHEVFYDDAGNPTSCTLEPIDFRAEEGGQDEISGALNRALADAKNWPVLDAAVFEGDSQQAELGLVQLELIRTLRVEILQMTKEQLDELKGLLRAFEESGGKAITALDNAIASADDAIAAIGKAGKPKWAPFFDQPGVDLSDAKALEGFVLLTQKEYDDLKAAAGR